jgi:two-component system, NtrC family, response regulator AtoC
LVRFIRESEYVLWMKKFIEKVAPLDVNVLITGPSGSGKTLVAEIIHSLSGRSDKPFVKVECASIPEEAFELAVFGPEKDLPNGRAQNELGKIGEVRGGTVLFTQIGDMPLKAQKRFLRFSETKEIEKPGTKSTVRADIRILATTNRNIQDLVHKRAFREDLYYRLNVVFIHVPPLRDRSEDLPDLVRHFIGSMDAGPETHISSISNEALTLLSSHNWPGNVRELRNVLERARILCAGSMISQEDVRMALRENPVEPLPTETVLGQPKTVNSGMGCLRETLNKIEKDLILDALRKTGGVQVEAADMLGLKAKNLWKKIQKHSIKLDLSKASRTQKDS